MITLSLRNVPRNHHRNYWWTYSRGFIDSIPLGYFWDASGGLRHHHYTDVIMTTMASQITSLTVVYSTVYSDADQRKYQSSATLAFVWGIHRDRWIPRTKGLLRGKCFHLMTSSWWRLQMSWRKKCQVISNTVSSATTDSDNSYN